MIVAEFTVSDNQVAEAVASINSYHEERWLTMYGMRQVGVVRSSLTDTSLIPKGAGARHEAEGVIEMLPKFEQGLADIEGFSHLYVIWVFHESGGYDLLFTPPTDDRPHGVFATRSPRRP